MLPFTIALFLSRRSRRVVSRRLLDVTLAGLFPHNVIFINISIEMLPGPGLNPRFYSLPCKHSDNCT